MPITRHGYGGGRRRTGAGAAGGAARRVGAFVSAAEYLKGQRARAKIRDEVNRALEGADVLVCATTPLVASAVGQNEIAVGPDKVPVRSSLIRFTRVFNLSGHPAASIPCGFTAGG